MKYHIVKYTGQFGFIKPWTAVRDSETFSQQFLTPSIVEGIEKKLFPQLLGVKGIQKIVRHRLSYDQMSLQTEQIQPRGWNKKKGVSLRKYSILTRGVLLYPTLCIAFSNIEDARHAASQHICLCRNEDLLFPQEIISTTADQFDTDRNVFSGYELIFEEGNQAFLVGYNRYHEGRPMYGSLKVLGNPVKSF